MAKLRHPRFTKKTKRITSIILLAIVIISGICIFNEVTYSRYLAISSKIAIKMAEDRAKVECKKEDLSDNACNSLYGQTMGDLDNDCWWIYIKSRNSTSYQSYVNVFILTGKDYNKNEYAIGTYSKGVFNYK